MLNRKIAISAVSIVACLAMLGGSAFAAFSSTNTNTGNTFGAGNMVLRINTQVSPSTGVFTIPSAAPGDVFSQKLTLQNTGTVDANFVKVGSIAIGGANPGLAAKLNLMLFKDANDNGVFDAGDTSLGSGALDDPTWANFVLSGATLPAGGSYNLAAQLTFDPTTDDSFQGQSVAFNMAFTASQ